MLPLRYRRFVPFTLGLLCALLALICVWMLMRLVSDPSDPRLAHVDPPPELAPFRDAFLAGITALDEGDGEQAIASLSSFTLAPRPAEEYRLYYLANALQLEGQRHQARRTLATLWKRSPRMIYRADAGFNLASLYDAAGNWNASADVLRHLAAGAEADPVAAAARIEYARHRVRSGDPFAALEMLELVIVEQPAASEAASASRIAGAIRGMERVEPQHLTARQRIVRAEELIEAGKPGDALPELEAIGGSEISAERMRLARGRALSRLGKLEDSNAELEPLHGSRYRWAIPALELSANNHKRLAQSIQVEKTRQERVRERSGTRTVTRRGKRVREATYRTVTRTVKYKVADALARQKVQHDAWAERLDDLLSLPIGDAARARFLAERIALAETLEQRDVMRRLIPQLTALDPTKDPALQLFWDEAWDAYMKRNLTEAKEGFDFISRTYRNPSIRRQARYWYARSLGHEGRDEEAERIYRELADAPFRDIYVMFAEERGAAATKRSASFDDAPDWHAMVREGLPLELQLAYELTELGALRDARLEIRASSAPPRARWQDALTGQISYLEGSSRLGALYLRRAFPELSTAGQLSVPRQFLRLYYPLNYEETIRKEAAARDLDPYLVMALIHQESGYDPEARSRVDALGLMQIMPATADEIGRRLDIPFAEQRRTDPELNIRMGTYYLRRLIGMAGGDWRAALAAYNGGIGNVWKWQRQQKGRPIDEFIESIPFSETKSYVKRITLIRSTYEQFHGRGRS